MTPPNPAEAVKPVAEPAPAAQQLVDSKLKSLLEPASQEPDPLLAGEMFSRGYSAFFVGMSDEALDYFVSAIRQDPKNSLYRYYLALTLRKLGRPADAETQVRVGRRFESPTWRYGIGSSLQRVQGPDRDWLERLRLQM
jgi:tetratricopeptide (TPR) repeat protein